MQHISELSDKSASAILASTLQEDSYHMAIQAAAGELVAAGLGHYRYVTHWSSGKTLWSDWETLGNVTATVSYYGEIEVCNA